MDTLVNASPQAPRIVPFPVPHGKAVCIVRDGGAALWLSIPEETMKSVTLAAEATGKPPETYLARYAQTLLGMVDF